MAQRVGSPARPAFSRPRLRDPAGSQREPHRRFPRAPTSILGPRRLPAVRAHTSKSMQDETTPPTEDLIEPQAAEEAPQAAETPEPTEAEAAGDSAADNDEPSEVAAA